METDNALIVTEVMEKTFQGVIPMLLVSGNFSGVATTRSRQEELWSSLEYIYTIDDAREDFLRSKGITNKSDIERVGKAFSSFLTQAKNFYSYAENSDYRSSALLYYYSFLNLAKAKLIVSDPQLVNKEFGHGIRPKVKTGDLSRLSTCTINTGNRVNTFNELYKLRFGKYLPANFSITMQNLFSYSTDIQSEYERVTSQRNKISPVKYVINFDTERRKCWVKLAVFDWGRHSHHNQAFKKFTDEFHKVGLYPLTRKEQFDVSGSAMLWYTFFESKSEFDFIGADGINTFACNDLVRKVLRNQHQDEIYDVRGHGFNIISPPRLNSKVPMDEMMSIYMAMFHLSEVVRYRTQQLEDLLSKTTKQGWLAKSFIEQAPISFLYRMTNWILGTNIHIDPR